MGLGSEVEAPRSLPLRKKRRGLQARGEVGGAGPGVPSVVIVTFSCVACGREAIATVVAWSRGSIPGEQVSNRRPGRPLL